MKNKSSEGNPIILTLIGYYLPGFKSGGPLRSVENLVAALGEEFHFKILTTDRDLGDNVPYPGVPVHRWIKAGNVDVLYLRPGLRGFLKMVSLLTLVDRKTVLYLNSFFARRFSMLAMLLRRIGLCRPGRVVLAPRGEFSLGALTLKGSRKTRFIAISRWLGIYKNIVWHASTDLEGADIRNWFPRLQSLDPESISVNGSDAANTGGVLATARDLPSAKLRAERVTRHKAAGKLRVVFVSRISRKKNLSGALSLLEGLSGEIVFDIYGPLEDVAYWHECQAKIAVLAANVRVKYWGEIEHEKVGQVFAEHDLFLFPTLGENYGHVIHEALAVGCPVLISDQTPWRGLEEQGAGWDVPLEDTEVCRRVLQQCVDANNQWYSEVSARAITYADRCASDPEAVEANRALFRFAATAGLRFPA